MSAYPVTFTHPETGATYVASNRLELLDAMRNGWVLSAEAKQELVAKTTAKRKAATSKQAPEEQS